LKIFVTRLLPPDAMQWLEERFDVTVNQEDQVLDKEEIIAGASKADALLCLLTDQIDAEVIARSLPLTVISNYAVGYNNIDIESATAHGVPVCITPGVLTESTAELAWALTLAVSRRICEGDRMVRRKEFKGWAPQLMLGRDVHGKRLGIIGMGRIGEALARRALASKMEVVFTSRSERSVAGCKRVDLDHLLETSDYISIHAPMSPDTHHLIDERRLRQMKSSAYLINTARGPIVDEKALARALKEGEIAGAGLDVYEREPLVEDELLAMEQVVLLPHLGSSTLETRTEMGLMAGRNAWAVCNGEQPEAIVNGEVLER